MKEFFSHVEQIMLTVRATASRKCAMREELLLHLTQAYDEELARGGDPKIAAQSAVRRLGDADDLSRQLQQSVPMVERFIFFCLGPKETFMSRVLWMAAVILMLGGGAMVQTHDGDYPLALIWLAGCVAAVMVGQKDNVISRSVGPNRPWFVAIFSMLFGMAIILPALAKMKQMQQVQPFGVVIGVLGATIVLTGLAMLINSLLGRRVRPS